MHRVPQPPPGRGTPTRQVRPQITIRTFAPSPSARFDCQNLRSPSPSSGCYMCDRGILRASGTPVRLTQSRPSRSPTRSPLAGAMPPPTRSRRRARTADRQVSAPAPPSSRTTTIYPFPRVDIDNAAISRRAGLTTHRLDKATLKRQQPAVSLTSRVPQRPVDTPACRPRSSPPFVGVTPSLDGLPLTGPSRDPGWGGRMRGVRAPELGRCKMFWYLVSTCSNERWGAGRVRPPCSQ